MATEGDRDVLAELDDIDTYLRDLIGKDPLPGQDANLKRLAGEMAGIRAVAQNVVELHAEYSSGVTHEDRVRKSMGYDPADKAAKDRIAELERQLAEARAQNDQNGGAE